MDKKVLIQRAGKFTGTVMMLAALLLLNVQVAYASDYAKNAGKWISGQMVWVALIAVIIVLAGCVLKQNYVGAIVTIIVGGVIIYFIGNPEKIQSIGNAIGKIIAGS